MRKFPEYRTTTVTPCQRLLRSPKVKTKKQAKKLWITFAIFAARFSPSSPQNDEESVRRYNCRRRPEGRQTNGCCELFNDAIAMHLSLWQIMITKNLFTLRKGIPALLSLILIFDLASPSPSPRDESNVGLVLRIQAGIVLEQFCHRERHFPYQTKRMLYCLMNVRGQIQIDV